MGYAQYYTAQVDSAPEYALPEDRHIAFGRLGWRAFAVGPNASDTPTILHWPSNARPASQVRSDVENRDDKQWRFRLTVSVDHHREDVIIEAYLPGSGRVVGTLDVRFPTVCSPLEIVMAPQDAEAAFQEGIGLRMKQGTEPVWFVSGNPDSLVVPAPLLPHMMVVGDAADPMQEFMKRMLSRASLQPFGWMEGAVLDGLYDLDQVMPELGAGKVIEEHLQHYFDENGLNYITSTSKLRDRIYGTEGLLPFSVIPKVWPDHPSVTEAIQYMAGLPTEKEKLRKSTLTAEGCYTLAYPFAVLGNTHSQEEFHSLAMMHLKIRGEQMFPGDEFYPQIRPDGSRPFANWGRGAVWFLLGFVRTVRELMAGGTDPDPSLLETIRSFTDWIISKQMDDGTWSVYVTEPETGCDTSATSGLGAAIALAVVSDILPDSYMARAYRALDGLKANLTPDGFLTSSAPENKGAEPVERRELMQRIAPRGISQMSMGMMAQLVAAIRSYEKKN